MKKNFLVFLLSLLAVIPTQANPRQPVGWSKGHDGRYQYLDFSDSNLSQPSAATAAVGQIVSITQEVVVDFQCLPNPGNPSPGNVRLYCDSGTGNLTCLTSAGANCLGGGGGGGGGGASSVGLAGPTGIPITNSPVTNSGTLTWAMPTGWILGDLLVGNGANSVARLAAPTTPNSVPQVFMSTPSGGIGQIGAFALLGIAGRTVSGTTDTILATDRANSVEYTSNSAVAITVPDPASSSGFNQSPAFITINEGQGIDTFTPQTSAVITYCNGAVCFANQPNVPLLPGQYATWSSPSTANWLVRISTTGAGTATPLFNDQLLSGGGVVWTGGLNFTISAACYQIASTTYCSPQTNVTLATADPSNPRIDAFIVDNTGTASVITGTPAGSPAAPNPDPTSQLLLTIATVAANATTPTLNNILVYDENLTPPTEWTCTPSANFNCNSTNNPFHGSKDIEATTAVAGNNVALVNNTTVNLSTYAAFSFNIRNKANWPNQKSVSICFKNGSTVVGTCIAFKNGVFGFNQANTTSYQQIVIPLSAFGLGSTVVDRVVFQVVGGNASIGFYLDFIQIQSAVGVGGGPNLQLQVDGQNTQSVANLKDSASVTFAKSDVGGISTITATAVGAPPSGTAGGDLSGTYPNPTVAQVNGAVVPTSAAVAGTNSSKQIVAATADGMAGPRKCAAASGSGTAYTCTTTPSFTPGDHDEIIFEADVANTGSATLNVNSSSAATIKKQGGGTNLVANDLLAGQEVLLIYDGTNWQMQGQIGNAVSGGYSTLENAGSSITQRATLNFISSGSATVNCADNSGATRSDCTVTGINGPPSPTVQSITATSYTVPNSDNTWRDVFNAGSSAVAVTLPQANTIAVSPFIATRINAASLGTCTTCATSTFSQSSGHTLVASVNFNSATSVVNSVTDTAGDTFIKIASDNLNGGTNHQNQSTWRAENIAASASNAVTFNLSGSGTFTVANVNEYSTTAFDTANNNQLTGQITSTTINLSLSNEVVLGFYYGATSLTCPTGWTSRSAVQTSQFCEKNVASQATSTFSMNPGANTASIQTAAWGISSSPVFTAGWYAYFENAGTNLVTVTPTTSTINGQTTLVIVPNEACQIMSDGTNYAAMCWFEPNRQFNGAIGSQVQIGYDQLLSRNTDRTATTIITTGASDAFYTVDADINCDSSVSTGVATLTITFTDTSNTVQTYSTNAACTTLGSSSIGSIRQAFRAKASTAIQDTLTHTGTQPTFDVSVAVSQLSTK